MDLLYLFTFFAVALTTVFIVYNYFKRPVNKKKIDTIYMDALNAMLLSDNRKAVNLLSKLVKKDSEHINAYLQLGNLFLLAASIID